MKAETDRPLAYWLALLAMFVRDPVLVNKLKSIVVEEDTQHQPQASNGMLHIGIHAHTHANM